MWLNFTSMCCCGPTPSTCRCCPTAGPTPSTWRCGPTQSTRWCGPPCGSQVETWRAMRSHVQGRHQGRSWTFLTLILVWPKNNTPKEIRTHDQPVDTQASNHRSAQSFVFVWHMFFYLNLYCLIFLQLAHGPYTHADPSSVSQKQTRRVWLKPLRGRASTRRLWGDRRRAVSSVGWSTPWWIPSAWVIDVVRPQGSAQARVIDVVRPQGLAQVYSKEYFKIYELSINLDAHKLLLLALIWSIQILLNSSCWGVHSTTIIH